MDRSGVGAMGPPGRDAPGDVAKIGKAQQAGEDQLRFILQAGRMGTWEWNVETGSVCWSPELEAIHGLAPGAFEGTFAAFQEDIHPEDREHVLRAVASSLEQARDHHIEYRIVRPDRRVRWVEGRGKVFSGPSGAPSRMVGVCMDVTERKTAEEALRESESRFRSLAALSSDWYWEQDEHFRFTDFSPAVQDLAGSSVASHIGKTRWELPTVGVTEEQWARHRAVLERHEPFRNFEYCRLNERGDTIWMAANGDPIFDAAGRFKGYRGTGNNITERRRVEVALRESEQRFRTMANAAPAMLWITEADGTASFLSRGWYEYTGQRGGDVHEAGWLQAVHPDDRETAAGVFGDANAERKPFSVDYRLRRASGDYGWAIDAGRPRFGADGAFLGFIGSVIDITERKQAEERQKLLLDELNHRVKNTLAIIQSIASQTLRETPQPAAFKEAFSARLAALAGAHSLLTKALWRGASLRDIVAVTLTPFVSSSRQEAVDIGGPAVVIEPNAAVTLCLVLHELATNAAKHGALTAPDGRIAVSWSRTEQAAPQPPQIELSWIERGGPPAGLPNKRGFGSRLVAASADQLGGEAALEFNTRGLEARLRFPLPPPARQ